MYPEEETHWGYAAYRFGDLITSGENPIPEDVIELATEIRWISDKPELDKDA